MPTKPRDRQLQVIVGGGDTNVCENGDGANDDGGKNEI